MLQVAPDNQRIYTPETFKQFGMISLTIEFVDRFDLAGRIVQVLNDKFPNQLN